MPALDLSAHKYVEGSLFHPIITLRYGNDSAFLFQFVSPVHS